MFYIAVGYEGRSHNEETRNNFIHDQKRLGIKYLGIEKEEIYII